MPMYVKRQGYDVNHLIIEGEVVATIYPGTNRGSYSALCMHKGCKLEIFNRATIKEAAMAIHMLYVAVTTMCNCAKELSELPDIVEIIGEDDGN